MGGFEWAASKSTFLEEEDIFWILNFPFSHSQYHAGLVGRNRTKRGPDFSLPQKHYLRTTCQQNIDEEANYSALASNGLSNDDQAAPVSDSPARDRDTDSDDGSLDEQTDELKMLAAFKNQAHQDLKRRGRTISISEDFASDE